MARQGALGQQLVPTALRGVLELQLGMEAQLLLQEARLETMGELKAPQGAVKLRPELKAQQGVLVLGQPQVLAAPQGTMELQLGMEAQLHLQEARLESKGQLKAPRGAVKLRPEQKVSQGELELGQPQLCEGLQGKLQQMQMLRP